MPDPTTRIAENVARIRGQIADAATRSGRSADAIMLVAVTKYVSIDLMRPLIATGCCDLGESRPQSLWEKAPVLADLPIRWHFIGHMQRNKVHRTLPFVTLLHSIDSPRLLAAIDEEGTEEVAADEISASNDRLRQPPPSPSVFRPLPVLLEVNISGEPAKHGFVPDEIEPFLTQAAEYRHVSIRGLMGMASLEGGPAVARRDFAALRDLRNRLRTNCPPSIGLDELSMGMSGDFEAAIEEGATLVRIGSALFEGT
jgi:PLP dependent protein